MMRLGLFVMQFELVILFTFQTLFPLLIHQMGSDVWMCPIGPIASEGAAWMHFNSAAEALCYLTSEEGGALWHIKHTQDTWAAKANTMRDGYCALIFPEPILVRWLYLHNHGR